MWKKIGAIGVTSNDNKSNRSRDENVYEQPFLQSTKNRMSQSQIYFQGNEYFFPNHLSKRRDTDMGKQQTSQQNIKSSRLLSHARSQKNLSTEQIQKQSRRQLNTYQFQELQNKLASQLEDSNEHIDRHLLNSPPPKKSSEIIPSNFIDKDEMNKVTQSSELISSETSLDDGMRKLKQCRSTPQFNFSQINSIKEEISIDKKIQAKKNLQNLKKQHKQIKKSLQAQLNSFSQQFKQFKAQMTDQIKTMQHSIQSQAKGKQNHSLNATQIIQQTKSFGQKLNSLNKKKAELLQKYTSLRVN